MKKVALLVILCFIAFYGNANAQTAIAGAGANANANASGNTSTNQNTQAGSVVGGQGQGQGQSLVYNPVDNSRVTSYGSDIPRNMPVPADINYPMQPGFYAQPTKGAWAQPAQEILLYKVTYTQSQLQNMAKSGKIFGADTVKTNSLVTWDMNDVVAYPKDEKDADGKVVAAPERTVTFIVAKTVDNKKCWQLGWTTTQADADEVGSVSLLGKIGLECIALGGNTTHLLNEGAKRELNSSGIGIGFSYTYAKMGAYGDDSGSVAAGGFGWSKGWATYLDLPWVRATHLYVEDQYAVKK